MTETMTSPARPSSPSSCSVCGSADARALVDVDLAGGARAMLCGSHALMYRRSRAQVRTEAELRELFQDRRGGDERRTDGVERRTDGDELGMALTLAFSGDRREGRDRRA
jgi:hypothetical protein